MNLKGKTEKKSTGSIFNNPAFQAAQQREQAALAQTPNKAVVKQDKKPATTGTAGKPLYEAPTKSNDRGREADPSAERQVRRSKSGSASPVKLTRREHSNKLPRVTRQIVRPLNLSPLQQNASDTALAQLSGPSLLISPRLPDLKTLLQPATPVVASARRPKPLPATPDRGDRPRSESPKKQPVSARAPKLSALNTGALSERLGTAEPGTPNDNDAPHEERGRSRAQRSPTRKPLPVPPARQKATATAQDPLDSPKPVQTSQSVQSTPRPSRALSPGRRPEPMLRPKAPTTPGGGAPRSEGSSGQDGSDPSKV